MNNEMKTSEQKPGRPRKTDPQRVPYNEVDRLLVFGHVVETEDGNSQQVVYPTYREISERYGVSHSLIAQYAKKHNCLQRRQSINSCVRFKVEQQLIERRATELALSHSDEIGIINDYLVGFGRAMREGRIQCDSPSDFSTLVRLKEYIMGGADSRLESHTALSLQELQARHHRMMKHMQSPTPKESGDVKVVADELTSGTSAELGPDPPTASSLSAHRKMTGRFLQQPHTGAEKPHSNHEASEEEYGPHRANNAPSGDDYGDVDDEEYEVN